jgi:hypothetical protein
MRAYNVPSKRLAGERNKQVIFVSHCLLSQNSREPGGAFRRGAASPVAPPASGGAVV